MIEIEKCFINSVKADLIKGRARIVLDARLTPDLQKAVQMKLGWWSTSDQYVNVTMTEQQIELPGLGTAVPDRDES